MYCFAARFRVASRVIGVDLRSLRDVAEDFVLQRLRFTFATTLNVTEPIRRGKTAMLPFPIAIRVVYKGFP